ncbi:MAG: ABC transporter permease [Lachnospiraceae bacterium]|nr:ABC transporter permease [Lachnospiraceae bacterium]
MKKNQIKTRDMLLSALSILGLIAVWFLVSNSKPDFFPTPMATIERLIRLIEKPVMKISILGHVLASLKRVVLALIAAIILGVGIGLFMGWNKKVRAAINPILMALRPIPPIAWIPLIILLFGIGEFPKVLLVFIGAFFPIVMNTMSGVALVDDMYLKVGKIYKANTAQMLRHVVFPAAMPAILAGIKIAISSGWMVVVAAEMLSSKSGLGFLINRGRDSYDVALIMVAMILIGVVGALLSAVFTLIERKLCGWMSKE